MGDTPADKQSAQAPAAPAAQDSKESDAQDSKQEQQKAVAEEKPKEQSSEQPQQQEQSGGWGWSFFQKVVEAAEHAAVVCKRDLIDMATQFREDTTEAVESLCIPSTRTSTKAQSPTGVAPQQRWTQRRTSRRWARQLRVL